MATCRIRSPVVRRDHVGAICGPRTDHDLGKRCGVYLGQRRNGLEHRVELGRHSARLARIGSSIVTLMFFNRCFRQRVVRRPFGRAAADRSRFKAGPSPSSA